MTNTVSPWHYRLQVTLLPVNSQDTINARFVFSKSAKSRFTKVMEYFLVLNSSHQPVVLNDAEFFIDNVDIATAGRVNAPYPEPGGLYVLKASGVPDQPNGGNVTLRADHWDISYGYTVPLSVDAAGETAAAPAEDTTKTGNVFKRLVFRVVESAIFVFVCGMVAGGVMGFLIRGVV